MDSEGAAEQFKQWLMDQGKSEKTAHNYTQAVKGGLSTWASDNYLISESLLQCRGDRPLAKVIREIKELEIYQRRNEKCKGMYAAALRWLQEYQADVESDFATDQLEIVSNDPSLGSTEKEALVLARLGQGKFRRELVKKWGACACTGFSQTPLLMASHIKPWRLSKNRERLDPYNGLLLTPNIDKAFDRNYISFDEHGSVLVSEELETPSLLSISPNLKIQLQHGHQPYMAFHRSECFRG